MKKLPLLFLQDYYTNGYKRPPRDASQDYLLLAYSETNGITSLTFERKLVTDDDNDVQFKVSVALLHYMGLYTMYHTARAALTAKAPIWQHANRIISALPV